MYNKTYVISVIAVFTVLAAIPLWLTSGVTTKDGQSASPVVLSDIGPSCVEDGSFMRKNHMVLLNQWRDDVVRHNNKIYINSAGQKFNKSLTKTCLNCHSNKKDFCDSCHNTAGVKTYCFSCHLQPEERKQGFRFNNESHLSGEHP